MMLADAAQAVDNKLYILGGGWSVTGPDPLPSAIAMKIDVPWDQTNQRHRWELALLDDDGVPVFVGEDQATARQRRNDCHLCYTWQRFRMPVGGLCGIGKLS